jgi:hypothetical protein
MANFQFQTEPLDENEDVLGVFYGNRGQWGAQFIVTNRRLMLGPLDTGLAQDILSFGLGKAGVPGVDFVKTVLQRYAPSQPQTIWLKHVADVQPTNGPSLFKAPGLRITTATQEQIDLRIVHKPTAPSIAGANASARDQAVRVLREAVAAAKQAST